MDMRSIRQIDINYDTDTPVSNELYWLAINILNEDVERAWAFNINSIAAHL